MNTISIFSFIGISLGVAVLIIVMSVMNGFRTELVNKIVGFNAHIIIKPYSNSINKKNYCTFPPHFIAIMQYYFNDLESYL